MGDMRWEADARTQELGNTISTLRAEVGALKADNAALARVAVHTSACRAEEGPDCIPTCHVGKRHPGAALLERLTRLENFANLFADVAESAIDHHEWKAAGSKGMQAPFHGEFAHAPPSVISDLRRLAKQAREALKP